MSECERDIPVATASGHSLTKGHAHPPTGGIVGHVHEWLDSLTSHVVYVSHRTVHDAVEVVQLWLYNLALNECTMRVVVESS